MTPVTTGSTRWTPQETGANGIRIVDGDSDLRALVRELARVDADGGGACKERMAYQAMRSLGGISAIVRFDVASELETPSLQPT